MLRKRKLSYFALALCCAVDFWGFGVLQASPTHPNPILPKTKLTISSQAASHSFDVELAKTPKEQQIGEMFRPSIAPQSGMLFPWRHPQQSAMWMKNTQVPLDILFISPDKKIESIVENAVPYSLSPIESRGAVQATLELPGGTAQKDNIFVGDTVSCSALDPLNPPEIKRKTSK